MSGIWNRTVIGLVLLGSVAWADGEGVAAGLLTDDIDSYLSSRTVLLTDVVSAEDREMHAMFWGEDPDRFMIQGGAWFTNLGGDIKLGATTIDVTGGFGVDGTEVAPFVRAGLRLWRFEIIIEGWWFGTDGRTIISEEFELDGVVFEIGDIIDSRLTFGSYRLALGFEFWQSDNITCTVILGCSLINTTGRVETVNTSKTAHWNEWLPLPAIGLNLAGDIIGNWIYELEGNWIGFSIDAFSVVSIEFRAAIGYQFNDWFLARVGYRFLTLEGDIEDVGVDLTIGGVYVEGAFTF